MIQITGAKKYLKNKPLSFGFNRIRKYSTKNPFDSLLTSIKIGSNTYKFYKIDQLDKQKLGTIIQIDIDFT